MYSGFEIAFPQSISGVELKRLFGSRKRGVGGKWPDFYRTTSLACAGGSPSSSIMQKEQRHERTCSLQKILQWASAAALRCSRNWFKRNMIRNVFPAGISETNFCASTELSTVTVVHFARRSTCTAFQAAVTLKRQRFTSNAFSFSWSPDKVICGLVLQSNYHAEAFVAVSFRWVILSGSVSFVEHQKGTTPKAHWNRGCNQFATKDRAVSQNQIWTMKNEYLLTKAKEKKPRVTSRNSVFKFTCAWERARTLAAFWPQFPDHCGHRLTWTSQFHVCSCNGQPRGREAELPAGTWTATVPAQVTQN